jgi:alkanesulfonate monooxygenase SsuD/methylene tetrahydromethanopterin reductase-like flavin-dependent oxidoreductase (luciferase family)
MLGITARHADEWNTWGHPAVAAERHRAFITACDGALRDPATMHRSVQAMVFLTDDQQRIDRALAAVPDRAVAGTSAAIVEAVGAYGELGFDEFIIPDFTLGRDAAERRDTYERLQAEVISAFD